MLLNNISFLGLPHRIPTTTQFFSQFWRLEVKDQGAISVSFWGDLSSWLANGGLLPVTSDGLFSVEAHRERALVSLPLLVKISVLPD